MNLLSLAATTSLPMNNINLNWGGLIGALAGGVGVGAILFLLLPVTNETASKIGMFSVAGVIGGAFAGNYLWGVVFGGK